MTKEERAEAIFRAEWASFARGNADEPDPAAGYRAGGGKALIARKNLRTVSRYKEMGWEKGRDFLAHMPKAAPPYILVPLGSGAELCREKE